jgi:hypothetical protein
VNGTKIRIGCSGYFWACAPNDAQDNIRMAPARAKRAKRLNLPNSFVFIYPTPGMMMIETTPWPIDPPARRTVTGMQPNSDALSFHTMT